MEMNKMCDLENYNPNDAFWPSVSKTNQWVFLAGALALPLATIVANVGIARAQMAKGVFNIHATAGGSTVSAYLAEPKKGRASG